MRIYKPASHLPVEVVVEATDASAEVIEYMIQIGDQLARRGIDWKRSIGVLSAPIEVNQIGGKPVGKALGDIAEHQRMFFLPMPSNPSEAELAEWWYTTAMHDLQAQTPKMFEYGGDLEAQLKAEQEEHEGAIDLAIMGMVMTMLLRWRKAVRSVALEVSVWFYTLGKVARLVSDYHREQPGKPDTWHDITVYSMMARRIQESGQWP